MSKLERKNHKVFGINATETKVGQFGSANATTKITTKDVEKIQALDAWEQGWEAGAVGNNRYPTQQERTGVDYEHSYQIGYMLQEGIPEWNKDTTYNKGSIVKAYNGTTLQNYVSLVDDNLNNAVTDTTKWKSGLANSDLSNLTTAGEKHFLNKSQITNCLLEVPQRIKYTLENGILTIKAGSVVIVPYGTKDKTADLQKGATFINENFKVYDTQFSDGKFFVWAEIDEDFSRDVWGSETGTNFILPQFKPSSSVFGFGYVNLSCVFSGSTAPSVTNNVNYWYDTSNNIIKITTNTGATWDYDGLPAFPIFIGNISSGTVTSIQQVFNGFGYIGSTVWVDKGVKGLIPNGRNADGSLNNKEVITDKLNIITIGNYTEPSAALGYLTEKLWDNQLDYVPTAIIYEQNVKPSIASNYRWYDTINGKWYIKDTGATVSKYSPWLKLADMSYANGKITSFAPKLPFRAADENDIDGRWVSQSVEIINGETAFPVGSKQYRDYDISNYLPNDRHIYELAVEIIAFSGSSTNATSHWWVSDIIRTYGDYQTCSCGGRAYSNTRDEQYAIGRIPMAGRTLRLWCSSTGTAPKIRMLKLSGYRKVR